MVLWRDKELAEILQTHENLPVSERRDFEKGKAQGFKGWPEEKDEHNHKLGGNEKIGKPSIFKNTLLHKMNDEILEEWKIGIMECWVKPKENLFSNPLFHYSIIPMGLVHR
jgi:hypothetical protein